MNDDGPDVSEILTIFSQHALAKRKKTDDWSEEDCKEEGVTDTDQYQVYSHSVQRGVGNRRADITKTGELIKSDRHLYPF